ncbi:MAG: DUF2805 domain-containing protein [Bdellovibrionaceae bacterium]|nr:DUF2805 domain-containing protein [Bdellovibrio sp.]
MRSQLSAAAIARWRNRAHQQGQLKHEVKRGFKTTRFKSTRQTVDGITKGWRCRSATNFQTARENDSIK